MSQQYVFKTLLDMPKTLYHGTVSSSIKSLEEGIVLKKCTEKADFGQGFYLTGNFRQASTWARSRHRTLQKNIKKESGYPVVISYEFDYTIISPLNYLLFGEPNEFWAEFVYANRALDASLNNNQDQKYDFVYGPLADGKGIPILVNKLKRNELSLDSFLNKIRGIKFPFPIDHQISFHSEGSIQSLNLLKIEEVGRNVRSKTYHK